MSGTKARQALQPLEHLRLVGGALHGLEHLGAGVLEGDVEVGEDRALGHQRDDAVDVRIGVDVMEADPGGVAFRRAEIAHGGGEVGHVGADLTAGLERVGGVLQVEAVGAGVLADDQQLLRAGRDQLLRLAQDGVGAAADEVAAQARDDAEGAAVVAALGNLHIAVVARGELEAGLGDQVDVRARGWAARPRGPRRRLPHIAAGR